MTCEFHQNMCAYQHESPDRCSFCHMSWSKITAPATAVTTRPGKGKDGRPIVVEEVRYLDGLNETPLEHWWRHALTIKRTEVSRTRKAVAA